MPWPPHSRGRVSRSMSLSASSWYARAGNCSVRSISSARTSSSGPSVAAASRYFFVSGAWLVIVVSPWLCRTGGSVHADTAADADVLAGGEAVVGDEEPDRLGDLTRLAEATDGHQAA